MTVPLVWSASTASAAMVTTVAVIGYVATGVGEIVSLLPGWSWQRDYVKLGAQGNGGIPCELNHDIVAHR